MYVCIAYEENKIHSGVGTFILLFQFLTKQKIIFFPGFSAFREKGELVNKS